MRTVATGLVGAVLTLIPLLASGTHTPAQQHPLALKIEKLDVLRPGIYEIEVSGKSPDDRISTGTRFQANAYKNVKVTTDIVATPGTTIGAELVLVGEPRRAKVPLKVIWRYPPPGLTNPETKQTRLLDEYQDTQLIGVTFPVFWGLTQDWHMVSGTWTLEIWHGNRELLAQKFQVVKPE